MRQVTRSEVLTAMIVVGPGVKRRLGQICYQLGVPSLFADEKAFKGEVANSNGGSYQVSKALEDLANDGLVLRERKGPIGAYDYSLAPNAMEQMYAGFKAAQEALSAI